MNPIHFLALLITMSASGNGYNIRAARRVLMDSEDSGVNKEGKPSYAMSFDYAAPIAQELERAPGTSSPVVQESLIGTSWTSLELALGSDLVSPITLKFNSGFISGTTGCNRYRGDFANLTDNSFQIVDDAFATTRMFCEETMEQELNYISFLKSRTLLYEIIGYSNEVAGSEVVQLVLYDSATGPGGEIVARFSRTEKYNDQL